ncbi:MAG: hypothetical protein EA401_01190 [Planctomycetota bacterium]|nr:MAG: hypothetical protein EA401_01190 [Planctomycetota bacterium]
MELDEAKIDQAVLALLYLNRIQSGHAWKQFAWDATDRLFDADLITDPKSTAKSVHLTEEGERLGKEYLLRLFAAAE